uniref:lytic transglycosylase domain-containing protein n=2 Tax=Mesorhizobium sp. L-8-10 TaxID=2744523 RepID=UPI001926E752|nr:lytic transglycosylase domain-containing protein [Mesorhizobium sp. L-8-10]
MPEQASADPHLSVSFEDKGLMASMGQGKSVCSVVAAAFVALAAGSTQADPGPVSPPLPQPRPQAGEVDGGTTASVRAGGFVADGEVHSDSVDSLKDGLDALSARDIGRARAVRDSLPERSLDRHIITWAIALSGNDTVPSAEIAEAIRELPGWPGLATLRRNGERAMFREQPSPVAVIQALGAAPPLTPEGMILLARAYIARDDRDKALAVLSPFWRTERLEAGDEAAIIAEFGTLLPTADHRERMERMLYLERPAAAGRVAALANAFPLWKAWSAVNRGDGNAGKLLEAVPAAQRSAGYLFARTRYLRRAEKFSEAAAIMSLAPRDGGTLIDPDAWWTERRVLSRELIDAGAPESAYKVAAEHSAKSPVNAAEAEFHAGWYALRYLGDPKTAAVHFARIAEIASGPISLSRAYYWLGRAAEAGGPGDAEGYFEKAAVYGTCFYGQLAAQRIGRAAIAIGHPQPSVTEGQDFARREAVHAIRRLEQAGHAARAEILYRDLAEQLTSPGELALLAAMAEKRDNHFLGLRVAKIAIARGLDIGALSHPVGVIPATADISSAGKALAYAVARQESEFNVGAVSRAGARGLLQLMPGTARDIAKRNGLPFSQSRLTTDAGYNATLGAAFLGEQLGRFKGSYVLTFAGYNAGPRRARQWISRYGDPRGEDLDTVVDWIERIPFSETRSYVQRVMENYQVYKMRLSGRFDIAADLVSGR